MNPIPRLPHSATPTRKSPLVGGLLLGLGAGCGLLFQLAKRTALAGFALASVALALSLLGLLALWLRKKNRDSAVQVPPYPRPLAISEPRLELPPRKPQALPPPFPKWKIATPDAHSPTEARTETRATIAPAIKKAKRRVRAPVAAPPIPLVTAAEPVLPQPVTVEVPVLTEPAPPVTPLVMPLVTPPVAERPLPPPALLPGTRMVIAPDYVPPAPEPEKKPSESFDATAICLAIEEVPPRDRKAS